MHLRQFPSARPPLAAFIASLGRLQPRLYSISSSLRVHPRQVHLTVGVVRFESQGRWRNGTTSHFLGVRANPGDTIPVFIQRSPKFRLPENPDTPIIMVGPGTGIAPFRAFLHEREAIGAKGRNWLFFGNQYIDLDFLYRKELDGFLDRGIADAIWTSPSRATRPKRFTCKIECSNTPANYGAGSKTAPISTSAATQNGWPATSIRCSTESSRKKASDRRKRRSSMCRTSRKRIGITATCIDFGRLPNADIEQQDAQQ